MYLLDTNVISEFRKPRPNLAVTAWLRDIPEEQLYICAASLGELQAGVEITRKQDEAKAIEIEAWIDEIAAKHQVLALDAPVCRAWGKLIRGRSNTLLEDALNAACAMVHGLTVATRNVKDFDALGARTINPFLP